MINWGARTMHTTELTLPVDAVGPEQALAEVWQRIRTFDAYPALKRLFDVVVALAMLVVLAPVMAVIAIAIKRDSQGPVIFKQTRVGKNRRPFTFFKFRSMYVNADHTVHQKFVKDLIDGKLPNQNGKAVFKMMGDRRITPVGAFIRKTSLDELPQLFNVLKGDMSLVGPRPAIPYEVAEYREWHKRRLDVLPGLTGMWQVRGRSAVSFDDMVAMDIEYVEKSSLLLDVAILVQTVPAVLSGRGAG